MRFHRLAFAAVLLAVSTFSGQQGFVRADEAAATPEDAVEESTPYAPPSDAEDFKFEAEVHRMLDIVVNSLYQNKDVFLRELISNASDALDKMRFTALTKPDLMKDKDELEVRIEYDADAKTVTIRDTGIGMTHDDLVQNLGTVARSGTTRFLEAFAEKGDSDAAGMIGKFGVGFYSTFLVSERVSVASKHPTSDTQYVWESVNGQDNFHVFPDPRGNSLERGTEIVLHLKEDCLEYADADRLKDLVSHYSEFITHPIYLRTTTTTMVEVEDDDEDDVPEDKSDEDEIKVGEDEDATDEEPKEKKTEEVTTHSWDEVNVNPAIWTRDKDEITDEEYQSFFTVLSKQSTTEAERWTHFNAEGNISFRSILYLPSEIPDHYKMGNIDKVEGGLKLYVRKVLISDDFDLMPRYLGFMRGVVDSDDLPLNVNRETLQESKIVKVIKKKLVRKALDMIRNFAKEDAPSGEDEVEAELDDDGNIIESEPVSKEHPYMKWYKKFSNNLKMGVVDDEPNRQKLAKLLRFQSTKSGDDYISFDDYIENMKDWQKDIYLLSGTNLDEMKESPFLEEFAAKDVEVIFLQDAVDEYVISTLRDYDGKKFSPISKENVKLEDEDEDLAKRRFKAYKKKFKPLTKYLKKLYGTEVMRVAVSKRLGSSPAIVSSSEYGHTANMERIMRAQAYQYGQDDFMMKAMRVMEINPRHPLILKLLAGTPADDDESDTAATVDQEIEDAAWVLYDMASLNGGFPIADTKAHSKRMMRFMQSRLAVDSMALEDEIEPPEEDDEDDADDEPEMPSMDGFDGLNMDDFNIDLDS
mmetsp:Transcript_21992/g.50755  ORF Transcript_21992/g.50755 Transcript_21992/m.50755 type:complete len:810 (-) Transcript_21992:84-2513(-)